MKELTFLEEGEFTQRDEGIVAIADQLRNLGSCLWGAVSRRVAKLVRDDSNKDTEYRKRTGSQILKSGYVTGCTDSALAFIVLARELGLSTAFVEAYEKEWLENPVGHIRGHVYTDLKIGENWNAYDPISGFVRGGLEKRVRRDSDYVEVARGIDHGELYFNGNDSPIALLTFNDMARFARDLGSRVITD